MDIISDTLTRVRNGYMAKKNTIEVVYSKQILGILNVLVQEGYIDSFEEFDVRKGIKRIRVTLKYVSGNAVIKEIKRVSKSSRRIYSAIEDLPKVYNGLGIYILSTSKGIMSDMSAKSQNVGGEIICSVF